MTTALAAQLSSPYAPFANRIVAVVGAGDSGKTIMEFLTRIVPAATAARIGTAAGAVGMPRGIEQLRLVDPEREQHRIRSGLASAGVQRGLVTNARTRRRSLAAPGYAERSLRGSGAAGSAPPWHGGGQGFESPQLHHSP